MPGGTGPVTVTPYLPTDGFEVSDFRIADFEPPNAVPDAPGPLADRPVAAQDRRIRPCSEGRSEAVLEVRRTDDGPQTAAGFELRWEEPEAGGFFIPLGMVLCDGPAASPPRCDRPGVSDRVDDRIDELS
ncbi:hypothetical protein KLP28_05875 [Nocardioidaceae bacterium]|nr:hypothetical protein KLP28_05875 [Nocardioidaceae bacterium]